MKTLLAFAVLMFSLPVLGGFDHRTIDGDTVNVPKGLVKNFPKRVSVRLVGINTPETRGAQCEKEKEMGEAAKLFVRDRLDKATKVRVQFVRWDKYGGRVAGKISVDGKDLAQELLKAGLAVPYAKGRRVNVWCAERPSGDTSK